MSRLSVIGILFILALTALPLQANELPSMHLRMDSLDAQVVFRKDRNDKSSFPVEIRDQAGQWLPGRIKVSGSFSRRFPKKSLQIKLAGDHRWQGQQRLALDAMATDGSMAREYLSWQLIHELGSAGPEVRHVRLFINNEFSGVFLHTEWLDTDVLARHGLGRDGEFFHPVDSKFCGDFRPHAEFSLAQCWFRLSPRDRDYSSLEKLVQDLADVSIEDFDTWLYRNFDANSVINWIVVNTLVSNGDTYNKNYFLYLSRQTGKWHIIPWDYDLTFGRNWDPVLPFPKSIVNDNFQYFYPPDLGAVSPLKEKTLRNPRLLQRVKTRLKHVLGLERETGMESAWAWFHPDTMGQRIRLLRNRLAVDRGNDPFIKTDNHDFGLETQSLWHYSQRRYAWLREKLDGRFAWDPEQSIWDPALYGEPEPWPPFQSRPDTVADSGTWEYITDAGWGFVLAASRLKDGLGNADIAVESDLDSQPTLLPPGQSVDQCIQRTWFVTLRSPYRSREMDLQLDYLQENSRRNELGSRVNEDRLRLWHLDGRQWAQTPARFNPRSNVFTLDNLTLQPQQTLRFVACSGDAE